MDEMFITPIQLMHIGESQAPAVAEKNSGAGWRIHVQKYFSECH